MKKIAKLSHNEKAAARGASNQRHPDRACVPRLLHRRCIHSRGRPWQLRRLRLQQG